MGDDFIERLTSVVGASHVITDPAVMSGFTVDWTRRWSGMTRAVVRPATTNQVAEIVRICASEGVSIVPQGGNTGLVGGSVPHHGEVVVSLRRLDRITDVDPVGRTISADAGVTVAQADAAARKHGLAFPVDLAARDTATLGGIVATNAGGMHVVRHGPTRRQIVGIEAVLANGSVVRRWSGLTKDSVGYDLPGLLCGSEGTLAIVTAVRMRLVSPPDRTSVALIAVPSLGDAIEVLEVVNSHGAVLEAAEFMMRDGFDLARETAGLRSPFGAPAPAYLLAEVSRMDVEALADAIGAAKSGARDERSDERDQQRPAAAHVIDAVIEPHPARGLWAHRENLPEAVNTAGALPPLKLDVAIPLRRLDRFVTAVGELTAQADEAAKAIVFGHLAEGNAHVNILNVPEAGIHSLTDRILRTVSELGGSISAEHGIGVAKREWLQLSRSPADIAAMRAIKRALDPAGLLNPHVLLPPG